MFYLLKYTIDGAVVHEENQDADLFHTQGHKLNTIGKATLLEGTREKFTPVEFQVVDHKSQTQTCLDLQLIKMMYTVNTGDPNQLLNE